MSTPLAGSVSTFTLANPAVSTSLNTPLKFAAVNTTGVSSAPITLSAPSTGASLTAAKLIVTSVPVENKAPSKAATLKVFAPLSLAEGS